MAPGISRYLDNWISVGNIHRDLRDISDMPLEDEVRECFHMLQSRDINQGRARRLADFGQTRMSLGTLVIVLSYR
jgi:hypothetical protein